MRAGDVYNALGAVDEDAAEAFAGWRTALLEQDDGFAPDAKLRGALAGKLDEAVGDLDGAIAQEWGETKARHVLLAVLLGGDGSTRILSEGQARLLLQSLSVKDGDEWKINHQAAEQLRQIVIAAVKAGLDLPIEYTEEETAMAEKAPGNGNGTSAVASVPLEQAEAPLSATAKFVDRAGAEWLFTVRTGVDGETLIDFIESLSKLTPFLQKKGFAPVGGRFGSAPAPQSTPTPANAPAAKPQQAAVAVKAAPVAVKAGGEQSFAAETLVAQEMNGKTYWSVQGGPFAKFGVRVWPEVLAEAGMDVDLLDPSTVYDISGFTAYYEENDKGHKKVTRLADNS